MAVYRSLIVTWFAMLALFSLSATAEETLFHLGVAPHTSARVILEMYQPLRLHLEKAIGQPVAIETAPDFTEFARRAIRQEYDIAITTGHQARLFQTDAAYLPLITYKSSFKAIALVAKNANIRYPADLKGKTALGLSPSSLVTLWGQHWLKANNLGSLPVKYISAADSTIQQILAGEAGVAFTSLANFQKLPPEQQQALSILAESEAMAGRVYMLNKRRAAQQKKVEQALLSFAESAEGKRYFEQTKLEGYRPLRSGELQSMEPYANEVRLLLNSQ
jgi:phosphonate transport system substrate-binding protein